MATIKGILLITPFFSPNLGGVESHLDDLITQLNQHKIKSTVLTYFPLTTKISCLSKEKIAYCQIIRFKWFGYQLFPKLEKYPFFDFLYLTPYLLLRSFIWLLFNKNKINIIHSHGFNAAFIGYFLSKIFYKKHLCSTHAVYENINGPSRFLIEKILSRCDRILCLSQKSLEQLLSWGITPNKISTYKYWINLDKFYPGKIKNNFTALFVGRLIAKKGIKIILKSAIKLPNIEFIIVGNGPLENYVQSFSQKHKNIRYLGAIPNHQLPDIYRQASIFLIASQYPEGFGRVSMEALATGIPVIGSNLGAIPEALDNTVSILFKPTLNNFVKNIKLLSTNRKIYHQLQKNSRYYAQKNFSNTNFDTILNSYYQLLDKS